MTVLFIADIHLSGDEPDITRLFAAFLAEQVPEADALYILGDLFTLWIGDDDKSPYTQYIASLLAQAATKTPIYLMRGNRDVLMEHAYPELAGCTLLEEPHLVELYGRRALLLHGDSLCLEDTRHQRYRQLTLTPWARRIWFQVPLSCRRWIGQQVRRKSREYSQKIKDTQIADITDSELRRLRRKYNVSLIIHGHTHRPSIHFERELCDFTQHYVLSDWHPTHGNVLALNKNGELRLQNFS